MVCYVSRVPFSTRQRWRCGCLSFNPSVFSRPCPARRTTEVRNLMQYSTGFGVLSTNSRSIEG